MLHRTIGKYIRNIFVVAFFASLILVCAHGAHAITMTSTGNVNWNAAASWSPAGIPTATMDVVIASGNTVTVNVATAAASSLTINNATSGTTVSTVVFNAASFLNISGALTVGNGGTRTGSITMTNGGILSAGGAVTVPAAGTWTPGTGTVTFAATAGGQTLPATFFTSFTNVKFLNSSGTYTAGVAFSVSGTLTTTAGGTLDMSTFALSGAGTFTNNGTIRTQNTSAAPLTTGKTWGGTVEYYAGSGAQTVMAGTYNNLTLSNTGGSDNASGAFTVNGTLTTTAGGTLNMVTYQLLGTLPTITNGGTIRTQCTTTPPIPVRKLWTGTVSFDAAAQTLATGEYTNLTLGGSLAKTFPAGVTTVDAILLMQGSATTTLTGTLLPGSSSTLKYSGSGAQTTGGEFITPWPGSGGVDIENASGVTLGAAKSVGANPLTIGNTVSNSIFNDGGFQLTATGTLSLVSGKFKLGAGTATTWPAFGTNTISSGTTVEYAATIAQTVSGTPTYHHLTISGASVKTAGANLTVNGTLTLSAAGDTLNMGANQLLAGGSFAVTNTGTIRTQNTANQPIPDSKTWTGTVSYDALTGGQWVAQGTYTNLTLGNTSSISTADGNVTSSGTLLVTAGGTLDMNTSTLGVSTVTNNGTIKTQNLSGTPLTTGKTWAGTVQYYATTGGQNVMAGTYNNLTLSNTSNANTTTGITTVGATLTTTAGGTFNMSTYQLFAGASFAITNGGTIRTQNTGTTPLPVRKTWTGTVSFDAAGTQTVPTGEYNNLTLSGTSAKTFPTGITSVDAILSMQGSATTTVTGTLKPASGSTLQYMGNAAQTTGNEFISPWPGSGGVDIENASGVTLGAAKSVGANPLTIGNTVSNSVFNDNGNQLTATGTLSLVSGKFKLGAGAATTWPSFGTNTISSGTTVEYAATIAQTVSGTPTYHHLTISGNAVKSAGANLTVNGTLTLSAAGDILNMGANQLLAGGSFAVTNTGIIRTQNTTSTPIPTGKTWSGMVSYDATSGGQTIRAGTYNNLTISNTSGLDTAESAGLTVNGTLNTTTGGTGVLDLLGANTIGTFTIAAPKRVRFTAGTTTTVTTFSANGSAGNIISIESITGSSHTLSKSGGGRVLGDYLYILNSTASPSNTWYAKHSTDKGGNSGWTFVAQSLSSEVWVSPAGYDDSGDGTINNPYKTIAYALTMVTSGGTLKAFGGTYSEHDITWPNLSNITLKASVETTPVTIDAGAAGRVINVAPAQSLSLEGITLQNGHAIGGQGGGIYLTANSTLSLKNCTIQHCTADAAPAGGAAYSDNCTVYAQNSKFYGNDASASYGGVTQGGSWYASGCLFEDNIAQFGAIVRGNNGWGETWTTTNCVFANNKASAGIAINNDIQYWNSYNCVYYGNDSVNGSGWGAIDDCNMKLVNTIFWGNIGLIVSRNITSSETYCDIQGGAPGIGNINSDPLFLSTDESNSQFLNIGTGSPCLNTGTFEGAPRTDQAGNPRPVPNDGVSYDMGAYELQVPSVTVTSPNGGETWEVSSLHTITWTASGGNGGVDHVNLYYTTNEGSSWVTIATGQSNSGSYPNWTSTIASDKYKIRVQAVDSLGVMSTDESNADFTFYKIGNAQGCILWNRLDSTASAESSIIGPNGTVAGGIDYASVKFGPGARASGNNQLISFGPGDSLFDKTKGCIEFWMKPMIGMTGGVVSNSPNFDWLMDNRDTGNQPPYVLEVGAWPSGFEGSGWMGLSFIYYSWDQAIYLGSALSWEAGDIIHVACVWSSSGAITGGHTIAIYINGKLTGSYDGALTTSFSMHNFNVCESGAQTYPGNTYIDNIKVWNYAKTDFSDRFYEGFESNPPTVEVLTPTATGITLDAGSSYSVTWTATDESGIKNIWIRYSTGGAWIDVSTNEANDGSYNWTVPSNISTTCKISIEATDDTGVKNSGVSANYFEIQPAAVPASSEVWVSTTGSNTSGDGTFGNPFRTIQKGLNQVTAGGKVKVFGGTYNEHNIIWPNVSNITLKSSDETLSCTIDAQAAGRAISIEGSGPSIEGFSIVNGHTIESGAGIYMPVVTTQLKLINVYISHCTAETNGGAIATLNGSTTIDAVNCRFDGNKGYYNGGATYLGSLILSNCIANDNKTIYGEGGAYYLEAGQNCYFTASGCTFTNNYGGYGGALDGPVKSTLNRCIFSNNSAHLDGGAIYGNDIVAYNCLFSGNSALYERGGAIGGNSNNTCSFTNCTFYNNYAGVDGGAASEVHFGANNCIFWGNTAANSHPVYYSGTYTPSITYTDVQTDDFFAGTGNISAEPKFHSTLEAIGFTLEAGSPCIDTAYITTLNVDLAGNPRPSGSGYDMGAYEYQALPSTEVWVSTTGSDTTGTGSLTLPYRTIQNGLNKVSAEGTVKVFAGTYNEHNIIWPTTSHITLKASTESSVCTIDAQSSGRVISLESSAILTIEGMTLTNALITGDGAGIYLKSGSRLTLKRSNLINDHALSNSFCYGGAVYSNGSTVDASNGSFINNYALYGAVSGYGDWKVTDCTFVSNEAKFQGGISYYGTWNVQRSLFYQNLTHSTQYEGGVSYGSNWVAVNCVFYYNKSSNGGVAYGGTWNVKNCTFYRNSGIHGGVASFADWTDLNSVYDWNVATGGGSPYGPLFWNMVSKNVIYSAIQWDDYVAGAGNVEIWSPGTNFASTDQGNANFLRPAASCQFIDDGTTEGAPSSDAASNPRPRGLGYDMGAYEFQGPSVKVIYPNGGENLNPDHPYNIIWQTSPESVSSVKIRLSTNEGYTWDTLITSEPWSHPSGVTTYEWTPTGFISTECKISIEVVGDTSAMGNVDSSDGPFELFVDTIPPLVTIEAPNGGEVLNAGENYNITWLATDKATLSTEAVSLFYSTDAGSSWTLIASKEPNDGLYKWKVPATVSNLYLISVEVVDPSGNIGYDISDATFEVQILNIVFISTTGSDDAGDGSYNNPYKTVQKGLNMVSSPGEIRAMSGTYSVAGDYNVYWPNKNNITLTASDDTQTCTIDAATLGRIITTDAAVKITIKKFTLTRGKVTNGIGGGIKLPSNATLRLENVTISSCDAGTTTAAYGGAVYAQNCNVQAINSKFWNNTALYGGVTAYGTWTVTNCAFSRNSNANNINVQGYVAYYSDFNAYNCLFDNNQAGNINSYGYGGVSAYGTWNVYNCTIYGNRARYGGVAYYGTWNSDNSIFNSNMSRSNTASYCFYQTSTPSITYSDVQANAWGNTYNWSNYTSTGCISDDAAFSSVTEGDSNYLNLAPGSPCINTGTMDANILNKDKNGKPRPHNWTADMGAYEFQGPYVKALVPNGGENYDPVNPLQITITWIATDEFGLQSSPLPITIRYSTDEGSSWAVVTSNIANTGIFTWEPSSLSLSAQYLISVEAINASSEWSFDKSDGTFSVLPSVIYVSPGGNDSNPGTIAEPLLTIQQGLNLVASSGEVRLMTGTFTDYNVEWPNKTNITLKTSDETAVCTIDAGTNGRILSVTFEVNASIEGIYFKNGSVNGDAGGAIKCFNNNYSGSSTFIPMVTIDHCKFLNNYNNDSVNWWGGAVYIHGYHSWITSCLFQDNTSDVANAGAAGGLVIESRLYGTSGGLCNVYVGNCLFFHNLGGFGGGAALYMNNYTTVESCTFVSNEADDASYGFGYGGGLYTGTTLSGVRTFVNNSLFWGNIGYNGAPQIYDESDGGPSGGSTLVTYSDIQGISTGGIGGRVVLAAGTVESDPYIKSYDEMDPNFMQISGGCKAIDRGTPAGALSTDLRGRHRPKGYGVDMGALEYQGPSVRVMVPNGGENYDPSNPSITVTWRAADEDFGLAVNPISIKYSSNEGVDWMLVTSEIANTGIYTWEPESMISDQYLVSVEVINSNSEWNCDKSDRPFSIMTQDVYVAQWGDDTTGTGSTEGPFRTIQKALTVVAPVGNIRIMNGTLTMSGSFTDNSMVSWPSNKPHVTILPSNETTVATIDCEHNGRFAYIPYDISLTIEGMTIKDGYSNGQHGGAFYINSNTKLFLDSMLITSCTAENTHGGVIFSDSSYNVNVYASHSMFIGNRSTGGGCGGVMFYGNFYADNCIMDQNAATFHPYSYNQGGVMDGGTFFAKNCTINENYAAAGGVIANMTTSVVTNCSFTGNTAEAYGGVEYQSTWTAMNCVFNRNNGLSNGGVDTWGICTMINNTFVYNNSTYSGGVCWAGDWHGYNNIYWYNTGPQPVASGAFTEVNSDIQPDSGNAGGTGCVYTDPQFRSINETNTTDFLRLKGGSLCIDKGTSEGALNYDLAGNKRPKGYGFDMGAYEYQGPSARITYPVGGERFAPLSPVTIQYETTDETYGLISNSVSLSYSFNAGVTWTLIHSTLSNNGSYGWTAPPIASNIYLISIEVTNTSNESNMGRSQGFFIVPLSIVYISPEGDDIMGTGYLEFPLKTVNRGINCVADHGEVRMYPGTYTIEASQFVGSYMANWPNVPGITLWLSPEATGVATIDTLTLGFLINLTAATDLKIENVTLKNSIGYGINLVSGSYLYLNNVDLNHSSYAAVHSASSTVTAESCVFKTNNRVSDGGNWNVNNCWIEDNHYWGDGGVVNGGTWNVSNTMFRKNSADNYGGGSGGIFIYTVMVNAINCTFEGNAGSGGGVIWGSPMNARNCSFTGNIVSYGGAVSEGSTFTSTNCVFSMNRSSNTGGVHDSGDIHDYNNTYFSNEAVNDSGVGGNVTGVNSIYWANKAPTGPAFNTTNVHLSTCDVQPDDWGSFTDDTGNISVEPKFVTTNSTEAGYLQLDGGSPCIDIATLTGAPTSDILGRSRPRGFGSDLGAYEFQGPSVKLVHPISPDSPMVGFPYHIIWNAMPESVSNVVIYLSTNEGVTWDHQLTSEAWTHAPGISTTEWTPTGSQISTECLISIEVTGYTSGLSNLGQSPSVFTITFVLYPPSRLTAEALPLPGPTYVRLYWTPSTSEVYDGYYVYRGLTYESYGPTPISSLVTVQTYDDGPFSPGTDYYYVVRTYYNGAYSGNSNGASAPLMKMTRNVTVDAPVGGGYSGGGHDAVPGSTIDYSLKYENIGFAQGVGIVISDKIPANTQYKLLSATGEAVNSIRYSNNNGATYNYTPTTEGTVDPLVTNISWEAQYMHSGQSRLCTFEVIIK